MAIHGTKFLHQNGFVDDGPGQEISGRSAVIKWNFFPCMRHKFGHQLCLPNFDIANGAHPKQRPAFGCECS